MTLHVIHVLGKRMIAQGTDGCSRGLLMEGVMTGRDMLVFVDLAHTAIKRHFPTTGLGSDMDQITHVETSFTGGVV